MVTFVEAIRLGFAKYADFSGRATRAEYWWWALFTFLGCIGSLIIGGILGEEMSIILFCLFYLAILVPSLEKIARCRPQRLVVPHHSGSLCRKHCNPGVYTTGEQGG